MSRLYEKLFILTTDVSNVVLRAKLSERNIGSNKSITFATNKDSGLELMKIRKSK